MAVNDLASRTVGKGESRTRRTGTAGRCRRPRLHGELGVKAEEQAKLADEQKAKSAEYGSGAFRR